MCTVLDVWVEVLMGVVLDWSLLWGDRLSSGDQKPQEEFLNRLRRISR